MRNADDDCDVVDQSGTCRGCDYCARMTPALIALASEPCDEKDLIAPDDVVEAALAMFSPGYSSSDAGAGKGRTR
jgi:hypothetical protein